MFLCKAEIERVLTSTNLITKKQSTRYPGLYVLKYKNKVFYDALWDDELIEFRGLVVDEDNNIVAYPFTKIFNFGERGTTLPLDEQVEIVRKVNGFMACATFYVPKGMKSGKNLISTTGSLDSPYVELAEKYLRALHLPERYTFIFEICDPSDEHIVKEHPGAYLIGIRDLRTNEMMNENMLDMWAAEIGVYRPAHQTVSFAWVLDNIKSVVHEGYVIHAKSMSLKIKSPYYLTTKFLARKNPERLLEMFDNPYEMKKTVEEEYHNLIDHITGDENTKLAFVCMDERARINYISNYLSTNLTARG